jgi:nucleotide-binding universal stress UspA family protein
MNRFKSILFVATRSPGEKASFRRAFELARQNRARLTVVDTVEGLPPRNRKLHTAAHALSVSDLVMSELRAHLDNVIEPAKRQGVRISGKVLKGTPFVAIIREVLRHHHDLVMKTATGSGGLRAMLFGTTAMHLFRKCPCPVWLLKPSRRKKYSRILAAIDPVSSHPERDSLTKKILDLATSLAKREAGELHVVHAWQLPGEKFLRGKRVDIDQDEIAKLLAETRQAHEKEMQCALYPYEQTGHRFKMHLLKGDPAVHIAETARKRRADVIVMGTITRTGVAGLFIGNTAERVLQQVDCSVVAVKPDGFVSPVTVDH